MYAWYLPFHSDYNHSLRTCRSSSQLLDLLFHQQQFQVPQQSTILHLKLSHKCGGRCALSKTVNISQGPCMNGFLLSFHIIALGWNHKYIRSLKRFTIDTLSYLNNCQLEQELDSYLGGSHHQLRKAHHQRYPDHKMSDSFALHEPPLKK